MELFSRNLQTEIVPTEEEQREEERLAESRVTADMTGLFGFFNFIMF